MSTTQWTQRMTMHFNGGAKFSELVFDVLADGRPTGITRVRTTSGSPRYLITGDVFACGGDTFDVLATRGVGLHEWLAVHAPPAPPG